MGRGPLKLNTTVGRPISSLIASQLNGGDVRLQLPFIRHFADKQFYLLFFSAVHLYPSVLRYIVDKRQSFSSFLPLMADGTEALRFFFKEQETDYALHQRVLDTYLTSVLQHHANHAKPVYFTPPKGDFKTGSGIPFIRDTFFCIKDKIGISVNKRSSLRGAVVLNESKFEIVSRNSCLVNGGFWIGDNYVFVGVSEFMKPGTLSLPDTDKMQELEQEIVTLNGNHLTMKVLWAQPDQPIDYEGVLNYFPFAGHLDDFMCPLQTENDTDIYLYAELDPLFYCGTRQALTESITELQIPLLNQTAVYLTQQLKDVGRRFETIKIPVLWDDAGFYSCTNCIVDFQEGKAVLHMPQYRVTDDDNFNETAVRCEKEIERRIFNRLGEGVQLCWIRDFNFTDSVRSAKGSVHCLLSPVY